MCIVIIWIYGIVGVVDCLGWMWYVVYWNGVLFLLLVVVKGCFVVFRWMVGCGYRCKVGVLIWWYGGVVWIWYWYVGYFWFVV